MKLVKCKIENFRSYENTEFNFSDLSVIIGKNDVGKSTLFDALDIFFENNKALEDDVNINSNENKFSITCFFQVEPQTQINIDASESERTQTSLESEYLLNQENLLQIKKTWEKGKLSKTYLVCNYPTNWEKPLITLKIQDLRKLLSEESEVNQNIKKEIRNFLFSQENLNFMEQEIDISTKDTDIVSIYNKLKEKMPKFLLFKADRTNTDKDSEITQITKAITQNAISEIEQQFNNMKENILDNIKSFANATLERLKSFDKDIVKDLVPDITSKELSSLFSYEFKSDSGISFNKRGSGVKRLFLLSFFLEDAERKQQSNMIYAIEEPETSQHPNYQRIVIESLQKLAQNQGRQILLTTHTPEIVRMVNKENIIFIQKDDEDRRIVYHGDEIDAEILADTLGVLPYLLYQRVLFVEGETDVKFLNNLNNKFECLRNIFDLKTITLIPLHGGGNVKNWIREDYLKQSNVKCLYFLDRDEDRRDVEEQNLIRTKKREIENYYPIDILEEYFKNKLGKDLIFSDNFKRNWDNEDIAQYVFNCQSEDKKIGATKIKSMFANKEIWDKINENNMQNFDEIKEWFERMKKFFI
ncbi:AAA family ATPase [Campylobacter sp. IFREMER_LSEM_CL2101]|uniref:ATP-dependent nuclease n=1 Tax=Campylobacter sp. IFREMER_LSEM_CL2101 TaxID=2911618 RepID=UPI0021E7C7BB|nr:AAA family ATPase [Campylobacter sp. IFREMER_LSEM_CL2101]MCV3392448.1 AAA family ATPase [Campylobacter sp. IFREMER_LSEM_CL2101]